MSEELLIKHCAPTLAGMKTGSLFNCKVKCKYELLKQIEELNERLNPKGLHIILLQQEGEKALIYVYRPNKLQHVISDQEGKQFLSWCGYRKCSVGCCVKELASRLCKQQQFPHEIGLFLGYPLTDVKAFIENGGKNCKSVGCWKVYNDEDNSIKIFEKYRKCTRIYCQKYKEGLPITRLTVRC